MTKYELLRVLEPFSDEIEIKIHQFKADGSFDYDPRIFYKLDPMGENVIILAIWKPEDNCKIVELKV